MKCKLTAVALSLLVNSLATAGDDCYNECKKKLKDCIYAGGYPPTCNDAYNHCITACPDDASAYNERAIAKYEKGDAHGAITELNRAIELDSKDPVPYFNRGIAYKKIGNYEQAIADYRRAIQLNPKYTQAISNLAWVLATCREASLRDGARAAEYARKACELSNWKDAVDIGILAAAYAETGDFERAIKYEQQAMRMEPLSESARERMQNRLALYEQRKPYRDEEHPVPKQPDVGSWQTVNKSHMGMTIFTQCSLNAKVVGSLAKGEQYRIVYDFSCENAPEGGWARIETNSGKHGWIHEIDDSAD